MNHAPADQGKNTNTAVLKNNCRSQETWDFCHYSTVIFLANDIFDLLPMEVKVRCESKFKTLRIQKSQMSLLYSYQSLHFILQVLRPQKNEV